MKSDLHVVTVNNRESYKDVYWTVEDNIVCIELPTYNLCIPLSNVICYTFPKEGKSVS